MVKYGMVKTMTAKLERRIDSSLSGLVRRYKSLGAAVARCYKVYKVEKIEPRVGLLKFHYDRLKRRKKYRSTNFHIQSHTSIVNRLKADGFAIAKGALDKGLLLDIMRQQEEHLNAGSCCWATNDSIRTPGDLSASNVLLSDEDLSRGQDHYRTLTNYVSIDNPLLSCPAVASVAYHDLLIDIAAGYLGCMPAIGGLNLRKSFANQLSDFDTLYFHCDPNSWRFLKFFFYLNDVDDQGGPFCYVKGSHRRRFEGWRSKYRWTLPEIAGVYGEENILNLTARVGDLIVADTTGFHRGTKVISRDRSMLTVDYLVHEEFGGNGTWKMSSQAYERLSTKQKVVADFAKLVPCR